MGIIYATTMTPSKNELLADWLVTQDFYVGHGQPKLSNVGGFRLEDPAGEVGIEFKIVVDRADNSGVVYHVPLSYRGQPLEDGEKYLIGTSEHGILGTRYIYDAAGDPVFIAQLKEFVAGRAVAQRQNESFEDEPRIRVTGPKRPAKIEVIRRPVAGELTGDGVIGFWENALGQPLTGLVLRTA